MLENTCNKAYLSKKTELPSNLWIKVPKKLFLHCYAMTIGRMKPIKQFLQGSGNFQFNTSTMYR